jgi:hypothetical protein
MRGVRKLDYARKAPTQRPTRPFTWELIALALALLAAGVIVRMAGARFGASD